MRPVVLFCLCVTLSFTLARATDNHQYGADEFDTVTHGISPDGKYAITAHGSSDNYGYTDFHIYLTNAIAGKKIGPLEEIGGNLDTGAGSFAAKWSTDSALVMIVYRIDRHEPLKAISYQIGKGRAVPVGSLHDATDEEAQYWTNSCSRKHPDEKVFGRQRSPITDDQ